MPHVVIALAAAVARVQAAQVDRDYRIGDKRHGGDRYSRYPFEARAQASRGGRRTAASGLDAIARLRIVRATTPEHERRTRQHAFG